VNAPAVTAAGTARRDRPMLGTGRGRMAVFAVAIGAILPVAIMADVADAPIAAWAAATRTSSADAWRWAASLGSPVAWASLAIFGFGISAAANWPNTARWMGAIGLAVLWSGLVDLAFGGSSAGASTAGAIAGTLLLWQPRLWPAWAAMAAVAAVGRLVVAGAAGSDLAIGLLAGALGAPLAEYGWFTVAPDSPLRREADLRS
jgi:hypothetical protein